MHGDFRPGATSAERLRVRREAQVFDLHPDSTRGGIYTLITNMYGSWKVVPYEADRRKLVREYHQALRHAGVDALLKALRVDFWWATMRRDC